MFVICAGLVLVTLGIVLSAQSAISKFRLICVWRVTKVFERKARNLSFLICRTSTLSLAFELKLLSAPIDLKRELFYLTH